MLYGYARISNPKQSIDRQIRNLKEKYPNAVIVDEAFTGTTSARPKWQRLFAHVKEGDTIIFDSVSRMSRNAEEGFKDYEALYKRGVELISTFKVIQNESARIKNLRQRKWLFSVRRFLIMYAGLKASFIICPKQPAALLNRGSRSRAESRI